MDVNEKLKWKRQKAKWYHDRSARTLPEIEVGQEVRVAPLQKNETWKPGTCLKKLSDRSYLVKTSGSSQVIRRNREFLNPAEKQACPAQVTSFQPGFLGRKPACRVWYTAIKSK